VLLETDLRVCFEFEVARRGTATAPAFGTLVLGGMEFCEIGFVSLTAPLVKRQFV
jgi:hypothetical protein